MSSPDWRVRDVTHPKGGGARSGEGGGTSLQRAWSSEERGQDCRSKRESYGSLRGECVGSSVCLVQIVETGCLWEDRSRVAWCGSSRLSVFLRVSSKRSVCHSPPRPHRDSGRSPNELPQKPRPSCRAHGVSYARHELGAPRLRDSRLRSPRWTTRAGKSPLCFSLGFCVNVCGWRQSCQVELF